MKLKHWIFSGLLLILCSCSMNFMYLFPRKLTPESTFQVYDEDRQDSLNLNFASDKSPNYFYSSGTPNDYAYTIQSVFYPNANSDSLNAWIVRPNEGFNGKSIFFVHGNAGNLVYQNPLITPYVERGYKVFIFDYSGFGFSQGKRSRKNVLIDANSSLDYMLNLDEFKNDKILIYGQSLGGHLATVVAKQNDSRIDGLIIEGAFSSHDDVAADRASFLGRWFVNEQYSAKDSIPLITIPVLVIHSIADRTVPFKQGKKLYQLATEPKEFYEIDSCHICGPLYYPDSIVSRMERLF